MVSVRAALRGRRSTGVERLWPFVVALPAANVMAQIVRGLSSAPRTDWLPFLTGARVLAEHPHCLYCVGVQSSAQASILGYRPAQGFPQLFVNPPLAAWVLRPLAGLPLVPGMAAFLLVLACALVLAVRLAVRLLPSDRGVAWRVLVAATAAMSLPAATAMLLAQWTPLLLLAALGSLVMLRRGRPVMAGLLLAALAMKPQTLWLAVPLLALAGSWRVLLGLAGGVAGWVLTGLLLVGPGQMLALLQLVGSKQLPEARWTAGLPGIAAWATGRDAVAIGLAAVLGVAAVLACAGLRGRLRGRPEVAVAMGIGLSLVCAPHVFPEDLMLLTVTAVVWAPGAPRAAVLAVLGLSVASALDGFVGSYGHLTALGAVVVAVGAGMVLVGRRAPAAEVAAAPSLAA